jgi:hypothetical protein
MDEAIDAQSQPSFERLSRLKDVTREYARFSRDAVGLGHVLGGLLVFLSVYLVEHVRLGIPGRLLLGVGPFCWVFAKEWLQQHYYQFEGTVSQRRKRWEDVVLLVFTGLLMLANTIVAGMLLRGLAHAASWRQVVSSVVCIAMLMALPVVVWRHLRAPYEFVVGVFLFTLSTILLSGVPLPARDNAFYQIGEGSAVLVAFVMLCTGLVDHEKFVRLRRKMRLLRETP